MVLKDAIQSIGFKKYFINKMEQPVEEELHSPTEINHTKVTDDSSNSSAALVLHLFLALIFAMKLFHTVYIRLYSQIKFLFAKILHDSTMRINLLQVCPLLLFLFLSLSLVTNQFK